MERAFAERRTGEHFGGAEPEVEKRLGLGLHSRKATKSL